MVQPEGSSKGATASGGQQRRRWQPPQVAEKRQKKHRLELGCLWGDSKPGWNCGSCGFYNFEKRSVCWRCGKGAEEPGEPANPTAAEEANLKAQIRKASDNPALKEALEKALAVLQGQRMEVLPLKDQKAKLMAQAKALTEKIDAKNQVIEEATKAREELKDRLATVYVQIQKLPEEEVPMPKVP